MLLHYYLSLLGFADQRPASASVCLDPIAIHNFKTAEVDRFAELSGDFNPLHCDPVSARRRLGGHQLVHGLFVTLRAINDALPEGGPCRFKRIKASFGKPISVGIEIESQIKSAEPSTFA
jgi:hypothetical protein